MTSCAAVAQARDELVEIREVVGIVGIGHDDEAAAGRVNSAGQRGAVASARDRQDPCAGRCRESLRAVR